jgi:hypothetical protein
MRKFLIVGFLVLPLLYVYGLRFTVDEDQVKADSQTEDSQEQEDAVRANLNHLRATVPTSKESVKPAPKLRRKQVTKPQASLPQAPKLTASQKDVERKAKPTLPQKTPISQRNFDNPMAKRWIDTRGGRFDLSKKTVNTACNNEREDCAQRRKDQDVALVGIVVKTDKLVSNPTKAVEGNVKQGSYDEYLPGIYVE